MFFVIGFGIKQENALLLLHSGQIEEIRTGNQRKRTIRVGGENIVGVHHCQRIGQHKRFQTAAVLNEEPGIDRGVSHGDIKGCFSVN